MANIRITFDDGQVVEHVIPDDEAHGIASPIAMGEFLRKGIEIEYQDGEKETFSFEIRDERDSP